MVLEQLGWGREAREEVTFLLESRLLFTQPTELHWRSLFAGKLAPTSALLVTLGQAAPAPAREPAGGLQFGRETGCRYNTQRPAPVTTALLLCAGRQLLSC